jgi:hypothetical protein
VASEVKRAPFSLRTEGSYAFENGAVVYGPDAKVRIANDLTVSSPAGVMVSDYDQKMIVGDLKLENGTSTMNASDAVVDVAKHTFRATSVSVSPKNPADQKKSNPQPSEPSTALAVTPSAAQETRQP